jgi:hypothetical protein
MYDGDCIIGESLNEVKGGDVRNENAIYFCKNGMGEMKMTILNGWRGMGLEPDPALAPAGVPQGPDFCPQTKPQGV